MSATFLATLGMSIIAVGLAGLCFITETTSSVFLGAILVLMGLGFGIFSSSNTNIIMSSVDKKYYGLAFSMGIAIMSISIMIGNIKISPEAHGQLIDSMRITFIICLVLCLFGVYTSSVREKKME
jgi:hypothetical protein